MDRQSTASPRVSGKFFRLHWYHQDSTRPLAARLRKNSDEVGDTSRKIDSQSCNHWPETVNSSITSSAVLYPPAFPYDASTDSKTSGVVGIDVFQTRKFGLCYGFSARHIEWSLVPMLLPDSIPGVAGVASCHSHFGAIAAHQSGGIAALDGLTGRYRPGGRPVCDHLRLHCHKLPSKVLPDPQPGRPPQSSFHKRP
jgi:hypothetical protein